MDKTFFFTFPAALLIIAGGYWFFSPDEAALSPAAVTVENNESTITKQASPEQNTQAKSQESSPQAASSNPPSSSEQANQNTMSATLHTSLGDIVIEFFGKDAPNTVANFTKLAGEGFYNGTKFHRVIKGFMVQGGDPLSKDDSQAARFGTGGPGYQFRDEIYTGNRNTAGSIAMANAGPDTNGSQFFINTADNNFLDSKHTVFGRVTEGLEVLRAIESTPTGANDLPVESVVLTSVTLN